MNENCECRYCKAKVDEYFCWTCGYNFNKCETFFEGVEKIRGDLPKFGCALCPKCYPKEFVYVPENYPGPIAIHAIPSEKCKEYHKRAQVQINIPKDFD